MGPDVKMDQILKDEVFDGKDYQVWKSRIYNLLKRRNLLCTVEKTPQEEDFYQAPERESPEEMEIRSARMNLRILQEEEALELVQRRLDNHQFKMVLNMNSVKAILEKFESIYTRNGPQVRSYLRNQLLNLRNENFENLQKLFDQFDKIIRDMEIANYFMPHTEKIHYFLESVPKEYAQLVSNYEFLDDVAFQKLSFSEMKGKFFNAELKLKSEILEKSEGSSAFVARKPARKRFRCYNCGVYGHKSFECPNKSGFVRNEGEVPAKRTKFFNERSGSSFLANERFSCVLDSGATNHMVNDRSVLKDIQELDNEISINSAKSERKYGS